MLVLLHNELLARDDTTLTRLRQSAPVPPAASRQERVRHLSAKMHVLVRRTALCCTLWHAGEMLCQKSIETWWLRYGTPSCTCASWDEPPSPKDSILVQNGAKESNHDGGPKFLPVSYSCTASICLIPSCVQLSGGQGRHSGCGQWRGQQQ